MRRADQAPRPALLALLVLAAALALLGGLAGGLGRLGVITLPEQVVAPLALHGALMVCGFFGFVIGLERAAAIGSRTARAAPALAAVGSVAAWAMQPGIAAACWLAAGIALTLAYLVVWRRTPAPHTAVEAAGAACWAGGTALWLLDRPFEHVVIAWCSFLVLTIAGERGELARFVPLSARARYGYLALIALQLAALVLLAVLPGVSRAAAFAWWLSLLGLAAWLLRCDLACRANLERSGWALHTARCLRLGYAWLALAAAWGLVNVLRGTALDASGPLHLLLLGFVFAMVFGHAPIVLPALLRRPIAAPTRASFAPVLLMSVAVALRGGAEAVGAAPWRAWGGALQALAIVAFALLMLGRLRAGAINPRSPAPPPR